MGGALSDHLHILTLQCVIFSLTAAYYYYQLYSIQFVHYYCPERRRMCHVTSVTFLIAVEDRPITVVVVKIDETDFYLRVWNNWN